MRRVWLAASCTALCLACGPGSHRLPHGHMESLLEAKEGMDPPALPRMKKLAVANLAYLGPAEISDAMLGELQSCGTRLRISGFIDGLRVLPATVEPECAVQDSAQTCADRAFAAYRSAARKSSTDGLLVVALRENASGSPINPLTYVTGRRYQTEGGILDPEQGVVYGYGEGESDPRRTTLLDIFGLGWSGEDAQTPSVRRFCSDLINRLDEARTAARIRKRQERERQLEIERQQEERSRERDLEIKPD
jgi:hypothetical protein